MIKENVWDNGLHCDLFKLFILASNGFIVHMSDYDSIHHKICESLTGNVPVRYPFQFNDRAVCEDVEEYRGEIKEQCPWNPFLTRTSQIIYRYADKTRNPL